MVSRYSSVKVKKGHLVYVTGEVRKVCRADIARAMPVLHNVLRQSPLKWFINTDMARFDVGKVDTAYSAIAMSITTIILRTSPNSKWAKSTLLILHG